MTTTCLKLAEVRLDGGTQCRAALSQDYIADLAEAWQGGAKIPAAVVFHDGSNHWLADGFHRYHAAQKCGFLDVEVEVRSGTRTDAVRYALGANAAHGQPRTNADKRRAVEIALKEFPKLSSREIAKVCAVSHDFVNRTRPAQLSSDDSSRTGADGKERKMPTKPERPAASASTAPAETSSPAAAIAPVTAVPARLRHPSAPFDLETWKRGTEVVLGMRFNAVEKGREAEAAACVVAMANEFLSEHKNTKR